HRGAGQVGALEAVDQRPALDRERAAHRVDPLVRLGDPWRDRQVDHDPIAGSPDGPPGPGALPRPVPVRPFRPIPPPHAPRRPPRPAAAATASTASPAPPGP